MPKNAVTLRGPNEDVAKGHKHMIKQLTIARVTVKEPLDEFMRKKVDKPHFRDLIKLIPISFAIRESEAMIRGCRADVCHALALLKDVLREKLSSLDAALYQLQLGDDAEWMVPRLIGKNGPASSRYGKVLRVRSKFRTSPSLFKVWILTFWQRPKSNWTKCFPKSETRIDL